MRLTRSSSGDEAAIACSIQRRKTRSWVTSHMMIDRSRSQFGIAFASSLLIASCSLKTPAAN